MVRPVGGIRAQFVRKMADKVLKDSKITAPPVDLRTIVRAHGIEYCEMVDFPDTVDALIIQEGNRVYAAINANQHVHRQRFSLAHELGHYFLHRGGTVEELVTIDNPPDEEAGAPAKDPNEREADLFAGELLVPLAMLKLHAGKHIPDLAKLFLVSEQVASIAVSRHMKALFK